MVRDGEALEKIRTRLHELTNRDQEILIRVSLTELNLVNAVKDISDHEDAIRKLEKFMYTMLGISISAHIIIELAFRMMTK